VTFTFSEPVTEFNASDLTVSGGTLSNFTGSGTSYTATFTPDANASGAASISVAAGSYTDIAGNSGLAGSLGTAITYDTLSPAISIAESLDGYKFDATNTAKIIERILAIARKINPTITAISNVSTDNLVHILNGQIGKINGSATDLGTAVQSVADRILSTPSGGLYADLETATDFIQTGTNLVLQTAIDNVSGKILPKSDATNLYADLVTNIALIKTGDLILNTAILDVKNLIDTKITSPIYEALGVLSPSLTPATYTTFDVNTPTSGYENTCTIAQMVLDLYQVMAGSSSTFDGSSYGQKTLRGALSYIRSMLRDAPAT